MSFLNFITSTLKKVIPTAKVVVSVIGHAAHYAEMGLNWLSDNINDLKNRIYLAQFCIYKEVDLILNEPPEKQYEEISIQGVVAKTSNFSWSSITYLWQNNSTVKLNGILYNWNLEVNLASTVGLSNNKRGPYGFYHNFAEIFRGVLILYIEEIEMAEKIRSYDENWTFNPREEALSSLMALDGTDINPGNLNMLEGGRNIVTQLPIMLVPGTPFNLDMTNLGKRCIYVPPGSRLVLYITVMTDRSKLTLNGLGEVGPQGNVQFSCVASPDNISPTIENNTLQGANNFFVKPLIIESIGSNV